MTTAIIFLASNDSSFMLGKEIVFDSRWSKIQVLWEQNKKCLQVIILNFWDKRYEESDYVYGTEANQFLTEQQHRLESGMKTLVVGDGEGRNGVWLASQGLEVLSIDLSPVGLKKAESD